ncbi:hypothetical protein D9M71_832970 [compost metagenome]
MPSFFSGAWTTKPGVSVGTRKAEMPFLPRSGSVAANTTATPARWPEVMNCLLPLSTQPLSVKRARVRRLWASEPACGSVRQKAPISSPLASRAR